MPDTKTPDKSRKKPDTETRRRLLQAAEELFDELGYEATGIRDVMDRVGVKMPTVYYYFTNKKSMFIEVISHKLDRFYRRMQQAIQQTELWEQLVGLAVVFIEDGSNRAALLRDVMYFDPFDQQQSKVYSLIQGLNTGITGNLERVMREGTRRGQLRQSDPVFLARAFLYLVEGFASEPVTGITNLNTRLLAEQIVTIFLEGAAKFPGITSQGDI